MAARRFMNDNNIQLVDMDRIECLAIVPPDTDW